MSRAQTSADAGRSGEAGPWVKPPVLLALASKNIRDRIWPMPAKHRPPAGLRQGPSIFTTDEEIRMWLLREQGTRKLRTNDIVHMFDVSRRQLQWWDEKGVLEPEHFQHARLYTFEDAVIVGMLTDLRNRGATLQLIRGILRALANGIRKRAFQIPDWAIVEPRRIVFENEPSEVCRGLASNGGGQAWIVSVAHILRRIYERLH
jgi:DNA-binding transcriptional MerR regulator